MKKTVYPVRQAIWGADYTTIYYFRTSEEREEYLKNNDYCDKLRARKMDVDDEDFHYYDEIEYY